MPVLEIDPTKLTDRTAFFWASLGYQHRERHQFWAMVHAWAWAECYRRIAPQKGWQPLPGPVVLEFELTDGSRSQVASDLRPVCRELNALAARDPETDLAAVDEITGVARALLAAIGVPEGTQAIARSARPN